MTARLVNPLKIGMFDSGIGGLSVLRVLLCQRPDLDIYYWADDAYAPYGSRSDAEIQERSQTITRAFIEMGIQTIVIACNTATAVAIGCFLEKRFALRAPQGGKRHRQRQKKT